MQHIKNHRSMYLLIVTALIWANLYTKTIEIGRAYFARPTVSHHLTISPALAEKPDQKEPTEMKEWVLSKWAEVGQAKQADKIIQCESGWNMNATNMNTNKTFDISLYQWNSIHIKSGFITTECLGSYKCQTLKAIEMWKKSGWKPWVCARYVI